MRIVAIGDIGVVDSMIHIGDEAMFEALLDALRVRGVTDVTAVSSNPAESATRYGVDAVSPLGFGPDRESNERRRDRIIHSATGGPALGRDDPARELVAAIQSADGVVVAGGGNLTSLWPQHVYERATIGAIAAAHEVPTVVTGQTIGPTLGARDSELVLELLSGARLVGLREAASHRLVGHLGVTSPCELTVDDASFLVSNPPARENYSLVSLASHVGEADRESVVRRLAAMLDELAAATGLPTRFLAHFGSTVEGESRGDSLMHDRVIAAMGSAATVVTPTDSVAAARLARNASFIVSSRYHPVVFGVPAGVPVLAIPVDEYTGVKLRGALANFGQDGVLTSSELLAGHGPSLARAVWDRRGAMADRAAQLAPVAQARSAAWWDRVVASFRS